MQRSASLTSGEEFNKKEIIRKIIAERSSFARMHKTSLISSEKPTENSLNNGEPDHHLECKVTIQLEQLQRQLEQLEREKHEWFIRLKDLIKRDEQTTKTVSPLNQQSQLIPLIDDNSPHPSYEDGYFAHMETKTCPSSPLRHSPVSPQAATLHNVNSTHHLQDQSKNFPLLSNNSYVEKRSASSIGQNSTYSHNGSDSYMHKRKTHNYYNNHSYKYSRDRNYSYNSSHNYRESTFSEKGRDKERERDHYFSSANNSAESSYRQQPQFNSNKNRSLTHSATNTSHHYGGGSTNNNHSSKYSHSYHDINSQHFYYNSSSANENSLR